MLMVFNLKKNLSNNKSTFTKIKPLEYICKLILYIFIIRTSSNKFLQVFNILPYLQQNICNHYNQSVYVNFLRD